MSAAVVSWRGAPLLLRALFDAAAWLAVVIMVIFATRRLAYVNGFHEVNVIGGVVLMALLCSASWVMLRLALFGERIKSEHRLLIAVVAFCLMQFVARFVHVMRYGPEGIEEFVCPVPSLERPKAYFVTIPRNADRACSVSCELSSSGFLPERVMGIEAAQWPNPRDMILAQGLTYPPGYGEIPTKIKTHIALSLGFARLMSLAASDNSSSSEWVFLLEDDAQILGGSEFFDRAHCYYTLMDKDAEVVFLDSRNAFPWWYGRSLGGGTAGMLVRRTAVQKVAAVLDWLGPRIHYRMTHPDPVLQHDVMLMAACRSGELTCRALPLVRETGAHSSNAFDRKTYLT